MSLNHAAFQQKKNNNNNNNKTTKKKKKKVYCFHQYKPNNMQTPMQSRITLFEPTILHKNKRRVTALFKDILLCIFFVSNPVWFTVKKRQIFKGNL